MVDKCKPHQRTICLPGSRNRKTVATTNFGKEIHDVDVKIANVQTKPKPIAMIIATANAGHGVGPMSRFEAEPTSTVMRLRHGMVRFLEHHARVHNARKRSSIGCRDEHRQKAKHMRARPGPATVPR